MIIPYVMRKCSKCGEWLVASSVNFHKNKSGKYGLREICKECVKKRDKKYRETHRDTIEERDNMDGMKKCTKCGRLLLANTENFYKDKTHKDGLSSQCKECRKKGDKKWKEENKETVAEFGKKYRQTHKETIAKRKKEYNNTPQGKIADFNRRNRRRAKEQSQGKGITVDQWLEMMSFFNWKCAYSGKNIGGNSKDRTIDHIDPLNNGGENEVWNCVPMDRSLNSSKQDKEMLEWYIKQPFCTAERLLKIHKWQEYAYNKWGTIDAEA